MFNSFEREFLKKSSIFRSRILYGITMFLCILIGLLFGYSGKTLSLIHYFVIGTIILLLLYIYIVLINLKRGSYKGEKWYILFNVFDSLSIYYDENEKKEKSFMKELLVEYNINTCCELENVIQHYRTVLPHNYNSPLTIIAVISLGINTVTFVVDGNAVLNNDKLDLLRDILMIGSIMWVLFRIASKMLGEFFGKKVLIYRIEDLLTEIYLEYQIPFKRTKNRKYRCILFNKSNSFKRINQIR